MANDHKSENEKPRVLEGRELVRFCLWILACLVVFGLLVVVVGTIAVQIKD